MCHQHTYSKRIAKGSSLNKKEMTKEETLEHQGKDKEHSKQKYG